MAQVLNLTGSLIQEVNPVDKLEYINLIENLTILELGENQVDLVINIKIDDDSYDEGAVLEQDYLRTQPQA